MTGLSAHVLVEKRDRALPRKLRRIGVVARGRVVVEAVLGAVDVRIEEDEEILVEIDAVLRSIVPVPEGKSLGGRPAGRAVEFPLVERAPELHPGFVDAGESAARRERTPAPARHAMYRRLRFAATPIVGAGYENRVDRERALRTAMRAFRIAVMEVRAHHGEREVTLDVFEERIAHPWAIKDYVGGRGARHTRRAVSDLAADATGM